VRWRQRLHLSAAVARRRGSHATAPPLVLFGGTPFVVAALYRANRARGQARSFEALRRPRTRQIETPADP